LKYLDQTEEPDYFALAQNNLGVAHEKLAAHEEPVANLNLAIDTYWTAINLLSPDSRIDRVLYARVYSNLGSAYAELATHEDWTGNLKRSQAALTESLKYTSRLDNPFDFAVAHFNLGVTYTMMGHQSEYYARGLASLACALEAFDELDLQRAAVVAQFLRPFNSDARAREILVETLSSQAYPEGCEVDASQVPRLVEKWQAN